MLKKVVKYALAGLLTSLCLLGALWLFTPLRQAIADQQAQLGVTARINTYLRAIMRRDRTGALKAWEVAEQSGKADDLAARQAQLTDELLSLDIRSFNVVHIEWWSTCCEPGVTDQPGEAGGARVLVNLQPFERAALYMYVFDVFTREQPDWGSAGANTSRHWVLRDVYRWGGEPLYWPLVYEPSVHAYVPPEKGE